MPSSFILDEDYIADIIESPTVSPWRREVFPTPELSRISAKRRSDNYIQWPSGESLLITLSADADDPEWLLPALEHLSRLASLPEDWDSYGGRTITIHSAASALAFLGMSMTDTTPLPAFVPVRHGGIQLEWHAKGIDLEVQISPTGLYHASLDDTRRGVEWSGDITANLRPLSDALRRLAQA